MTNINNRYNFTYIPNPNLTNQNQSQSQYKYIYKIKYTGKKFKINNINYDMEKRNDKHQDFMALHDHIANNLGAEDFDLSFDFQNKILTLNTDILLTDNLKNKIKGEGTVVV
jgi:hypothetical protein